MVYTQKKKVVVIHRKFLYSRKDIHQGAKNGKTTERNLSNTSNKDVVKRTYRRGKLVGEETIRRNTMPKSAKLGGNG